MFSTVTDLVEALGTRDPAAYREFDERFRGPIAKLVEKLSERGKLQLDRDAAIECALRWAKLYVRSVDKTKLSGMTYLTLTSLVLYGVVRVISEKNDSNYPWPKFDKISNSRMYELATWTMGRNCFGGDWLGTDHSRRGVVWGFLVDVTGPGGMAGILAYALPFLWWLKAAGDLRRQECEPADLLNALTDELRKELPWGLFVEASLAKFDPDGTTTLTALGSRDVLLHRRSSDLLAIEKLQTGISPSPSADEELRQSIHGLEDGDATLIATDGFSEELAQVDDLRERIERRLQEARNGEFLHDVVVEELRRNPSDALEHGDATIVSVRFHAKP